MDSTGQAPVSFRCSPEMAELIGVVARHEDRDVSKLCRRALMLYFSEGGYLDGAGLDGAEKLVREMVERAEKELKSGS